MSYDYNIKMLRFSYSIQIALPMQPFIMRSCNSEFQNLQSIFVPRHYVDLNAEERRYFEAFEIQNYKERIVNGWIGRMNG